MADNIRLDGRSLDDERLGQIADGAGVDLDVDAVAVMAASHQRLMQAVADGAAIYGVTTGLGPKVTQALSADEVTTFSLNTIRGRAHAVGPPLPRSIVRGAMAVRLNSLLSGATGAAPALAHHIQACLNADLVPHIGQTTSIGAADLMWGGSFAHTLVGEGRFLDQPEDESAADALKRHGIAPLALGPRDGLALVSHSSFTASYAALALQRARKIWGWAQEAAALSLEGFRGNLTPFRADVLALRPQPGAAEAGQDLLRRLQGSHLFAPNAARRLQDPLSFRNIAQVHGSVAATLETLQTAVLGEVNGASDSPVVLGDEGIVSSGNFLNPSLTVAAVATGYALVQLAAQMTARIARLLAQRFTDLPNGLNDPSAGNAGLGPITKVSEALFAEISHLATPPPVYPSSSADGVEDVISFGALSGRALLDISERLSTLIAIELMVAAQAVELRGLGDQIAPSLKATLRTVRDVSPALGEDRSLSLDLERLSTRVLRPLQ